MASRALGLEPSTKTFAASTGSLTFGASTTSISQPRLRHYREFLTPALHRRFTRAAGVVFLACYVEAILLGEKKSCKSSVDRTFDRRALKATSLHTTLPFPAYREHTNSR